MTCLNLAFLRTLLRYVLIACIVFFGYGVTTIKAQTTKEYNVILIALDDLGYGDLGFMGCDEVKTPIIDSLYGESTYFPNFYANSPVCSPARASLLTGLHPNNTGILGVLRSHHDSIGLDPSKVTLPRILRDNGYVTGMTGKWHLGIAQNNRPGKLGFDYSYGPLSGMVDYYSHIGKGGMDGQHNLFENNKEVFEDGYLTNLITHKSVQFIEDHHKQKFFLNINFTAPHRPIQVDSSRYSGKEAIAHLSERQKYLSMIESVDASLAAIFNSLSKHGLNKKTIVILTNDHGWPVNNPESIQISSNRDLKGGKYYLYEGGLKVPFLISVPGLQHSETDQIGSLMDLLPTTLDLLHIPFDSSEFDGISLASHLNNRRKNLDERTLFWRFEDVHTPLQKAIRVGNWKLLVMDNEFSLINLEEDPGESNDLKFKYPELVKKMTDQYNQWEASVARLDWDSVGE